ncbi:uncharacterized protein J3R85_003180 [Psidium guajava]|nr:uncharacterized protein J3R85_003180 [Psidium guajava]
MTPTTKVAFASQLSLLMTTYKPAANKETESNLHLQWQYRGSICKYRRLRVIYLYVEEHDDRDHQVEHGEGIVCRDYMGHSLLLWQCHGLVLLPNRKTLPELPDQRRKSRWP